NTWALRRALLAVRTGLDLPDRQDLVVVQASANYFTDPFGEQPALSGLLRVPEPFLSRGQLLWQGKGNAYDRRLDSYLAIAGRDSTAKQSLTDWQLLWGRAGEADALAVDAGP